MTKNSITTTSLVDSLIGAYRSHVLGRTLPGPVSLDFTLSNREIAVQPGGALDLRSRLGNLLVWAYTLDDVTATWWHTRHGALHVSITGRTAGGARMKVYGGGPFAHCLGLVRLAVDEREGVSLDELYTLLGLLRDGQHDREAA